MKKAERKRNRNEYCLRCTLMGDARDWHICFQISVLFYFNIYCHNTSTHHTHTPNSDSHNDVHTDVFAHKLTHKPVYVLHFPGSNTVSTSSLFPSASPHRKVPPSPIAQSLPPPRSFFQVAR